MKKDPKDFGPLSKLKIWGQKVSNLQLNYLFFISFHTEMDLALLLSR